MKSGPSGRDQALLGQVLFDELGCSNAAADAIKGRRSHQNSVLTVANETTPGTIYELGGPEVYTFKELMQFALATIDRRRLLLPIPFWAAKLIGQFLQFLPSPLLTPDQVELLKQDNVVSESALREERTLKGLRIEPRSIEVIVPSYLWRYRKTGQFRRPD